MIDVDRYSTQDAAGRRKQAERRMRAIELERSSYIDHWREIAEYMLPRRGRFLTPDARKGTKRNDKIINNTATRAARTLAAGLMAGATSPARPWFKLGPPDPEMAEFAPVKHWLAAVESRMREVLNRSNAYNALTSMHLETGVFGTAPILIDEDRDNIIHVHNMTIGAYGIATSHLGAVDTLLREEAMTVAQVVSRFGLSKCSQRVQDLYKRAQHDEWVKVMHLIQPNMDYQQGSALAVRFRFKSCYWEHGALEPGRPAFLYEGGYHEWPAPTSRWDVRPGDIYASSPGMEALGDVKQLQMEELRKGQGIDKLVNPPMVAPPALRNSPSSTLPGGVTYVDSLSGGGAAAGFRPAYQVDPKLGELRIDINAVEIRIKETFHEDLFRAIISLDRRQITAREIDERHEEKLLMLGPAIERLHQDTLSPFIDRVFGIMVRRQLLPPAPRELAGAPLQTEYISLLAQAQRAVGMSSVERLAGFAINLAQVKPDVIDKVDFDQAIDEYAHMAGVPPKLVVPDEIVAQRREARAKVQAREAQMAQQQVAADAAQKLGGVSLDENTALREILNPVA